MSSLASAAAAFEADEFSKLPHDEQKGGARMIIRAMKPDDMSACRGVIAECWNPLTAQIAEPELAEMFVGGGWRPHFYVAEAGGIIGMAGYNTSWLTYGIYNLFWVATRPTSRRQGVATRLVQRCVDDLTPFADAIMLVTGVPDFYSRWHFQAIAKAPNSENFGDDLMMLKLSRA